MSVRVESAALVGLLADLVQTAAVADEGLPMAGIVLHGDRGDRVEEPGRADLLVGTSCNRKIVGHTWALAEGILPPMLWPLDDARTVLAALKLKIRGERENGPKHSVAIRQAGASVAITEDPAQQSLLEDEKPWSFAFPLGCLDDYPRGVWDILAAGDRHTPQMVFDGDVQVTDQPRTDLDPAHLAPFVAIAKRRGWVIQTYRHHHRLAVHVQIGWGFRGVVMPRPFSDSEDGSVPDARVYDPELPPPPPKPAQKAAGGGDSEEPAAEPVDLDVPDWGAQDGDES